MPSLRSALAASALLAVAAAVNPVQVQGQDFIDTATGKRFQVLGVDYQPGGSAGYNPGSGVDPLSNPRACLRDASLMQSLGVNTIRVYNLDPYINHNECASIFNYAGIYMVLDVNSPLPNESINQAAPWTSYNSAYLNRTFAILDAFRQYPNTLGFFSANELINDLTNDFNAPYIRAVTRDLKQYMAARGGRQIPVGYSAADVRPILVDTANYVSCSISGANDGSEGGKSDFFGLNSYSWCNGDNFMTSTYDVLASDFANTTIPVFFSEFGCIQTKPRTWNEIGTLYSSAMSTWSGGLVYEWTQEANDYGLVQVNSDGSLTILQDYVNLQGQYNSLNIANLQNANSTASSLTPPVCGANLLTGGFFSNFTLPNQPPGVSSLIASGAPGASVGTTVSVTATSVAINVTPVSGAVTSNLAITRAVTANVPAGATGSATGSVSVRPSSTGTRATGSASGAAASGSSTASPGAASKNTAAYGAGIAGLFMWLAAL